LYSFLPIPFVEARRKVVTGPARLLSLILPFSPSSSRNFQFLDGLISSIAILISPAGNILVHARTTRRPSFLNFILCTLGLSERLPRCRREPGHCNHPYFYLRVCPTSENIHPPIFEQAHSWRVSWWQRPSRTRTCLLYETVSLSPLLTIV